MIGIQPRSIRFKLTAWYAGMLALAVIILALTVATLLERRLNANFDDDLLKTAEAIRRTAVPQDDFDGQLGNFELPALDPFSIAGYFIELYDFIGSPDGRVSFRSETLGSRDLPYWLPSKDDNASGYHETKIDGQSLRLY
ncbi:MAG: hypothetical protein ACRDHN_15225, partial [Thermomicrobiales bacterium]